MLGKFALTVFLTFLWLLDSRGTVEANDIRVRHSVQNTQESVEQLFRYDITPAAAIVGAVPAATFPVCRPPVFSEAPVVLFLLRPSTLDEPALIVGGARCARITRSGVTQAQLVPLFFVIYPGTGGQNVKIDSLMNIEKYVPADEPPPSQFVPGRMDAGHSIG